MTKNQKSHIMLNEKNANTMHDSTQLSYREYINKKYQFLNQHSSTCTNQYILIQNKKIAHALSYATHTFYVSPQYQACSKSRKRYYNSCNPQEKNKARHKIKYFYLFENFQCFWIFLKK